MSSCSSCSNSASQAYKPQTAQSYVQQQLAAVQKPAEQAAKTVTTATPASSGGGRFLDISV